MPFADSILVKKKKTICKALKLPLQMIEPGKPISIASEQTLLIFVETDL
jgi:hypothetical protein